MKILVALVCAGLLVGSVGCSLALEDQIAPPPTFPAAAPPSPPPALAAPDCPDGQCGVPAAPPAHVAVKPLSDPGCADGT